MKTRTDFSARSILITGSSSGLGRALAVEYAAPGVTLFISGRNAERLAESVRLCEEKGAQVFASRSDVTNRARMDLWIAQSDDHCPLDLVIANAGVSRDTAETGSGEEAARGVFAINGNGLVNTVLPAVQRMRLRKKGQIAIISSLASFRGLPNATAYCASKAMARVWGESLRASLRNEGICVSVVCPGFIRSRLTDTNRFRMPLFMEADKAALKIRRGLEKGKGRIAFPWPLYFGSHFLGSCPDFLADWLTRYLPVKDIDF